MRHLHFVQSLEALQGGGLGRAAFELHEAFLQRQAGSLLVATSGDESPYLLPNTREYPRNGPAKGFFSLALIREADTLVAEADVLHGHGFYVSPNWIFGSRCRARKKPLVYHPHGFFEPWILQRSRWRKRVAHWLFETENFKAARLWRALTAKEADQIRAQGIRAPVVVAPNGIRLEFFDKVDGSSTNRNRRRILFLGRLHPKKGIDLLIQAWSRLRASNPDWELVVAGPDEGGYLESLKATVRRLHLEESVTFPGTITGTEKVRLLKSADLFALTSHSEGFSVAILEAMACGLPILFTTPCNFPELATEGGGFQCEPEPESVRRGLAEALGAVKNEGQERGACARRLVEHGYTWPAISKRIVEACEHYCQ